MASTKNAGKLDIAQVDLDSLSFGDVEDLETHTGMEFDDILELVKAHREAPEGHKPRLPMKLLIAMVLLALKRSNPDATIEEARAVRVADVMSSKKTAGRARNPRATAPLEPIATAKPRRTSRAAK